MPLKIHKCLGCGAPLQGLVCQYCDSVHEDPDAPKQPQEFIIHTPEVLYADNAVYTTNEIRDLMGMPPLDENTRNYELFSSRR